MDGTGEYYKPGGVFQQSLALRAGGSSASPCRCSGDQHALLSYLGEKGSTWFEEVQFGVLRVVLFVEEVLFGNDEVTRLAG